jgi:hypothetical protein
MGSLEASIGEPSLSNSGRAQRENGMDGRQAKAREMCSRSRLHALHHLGHMATSWARHARLVSIWLFPSRRTSSCSLFIHATVTQLAPFWHSLARNGFVWGVTAAQQICQIWALRRDDWRRRLSINAVDGSLRPPMPGSGQPPPLVHRGWGTRDCVDPASFVVRRMLGSQGPPFPSSVAVRQASAIQDGLQHGEQEYRCPARRIIRAGVRCHAAALG